jgi:hypothetical protein
MLRWGLPALVAMVALTWLAVVYSQREDPSAANPDGSIDGLTSVLTRQITDDMVRFTFEDATAASGISFRHFPATRSSLLPEDMGPGLAVGDVDGDDDLDVFLVNFACSATTPLAEADEAGRCALWRNEGDGTFTDVSAGAGLDLALYGQGAAFGDYDDDGDLDLYITAWGRNRLMNNAGDGTFTDATDAAGVGDDGFGAGCAWGDYDADGDLDLYVTNYVDFEPPDEAIPALKPQYDAEVPYTINPSAYPPQPNRLYRNEGDGTFTDVGREAGVSNPSGRSLGAIWFDFDLDGLLDLYVANDVSSNGVYRNTGDGAFEDVGASSLAADYRGAMGLAVTDYGNDGDLDLFVTHWVAQENAFFENMIAQELLDDGGEARLLFMDSADRTGLGQISLKMVGWSAGFSDFDDDGWPDLWVMNGNTLEQADNPTALQRQQSHVFRQEAGRGFFEIGSRACPSLGEDMVARGGVAADWSGDGRLDLIIARHGEGPLLLRNTTTTDHAFLHLRLRQHGGNRNAVGAFVTVRAGDHTQRAQVGADGAYLSSHPTDLHFGLGTATVIDELTVRWPDGFIETHTAVPVGQLLLTHAANYTR